MAAVRSLTVKTGAERAAAAGENTSCQDTKPGASAVVVWSCDKIWRAVNLKCVWNVFDWWQEQSVCCCWSVSHLIKYIHTILHVIFYLLFTNTACRTIYLPINNNTLYYCTSSVTGGCRTQSRCGKRFRTRWNIQTENQTWFLWGQNPQHFSEHLLPSSGGPCFVLHEHREIFMENFYIDWHGLNESLKTKLCFSSVS